MKTGLAPITRMFSGWGLGFLDYDNDGWLDLVLTSGHPDDTVDERGRGVTYREPLFLLHNLEGRKLENVSDQAGSAFTKNTPRAAWLSAISITMVSRTLFYPKRGSATSLAE